MANIPLKSIKFPDLADTYTVPSNAGELPYNKNATYPADTVGKALQNIGDSSAPAIIETAQGSIASFDDGADNVPVKDLVAEIVPLQSGSGDPSPDNVRAISGWSECNVCVAGDNLFNPSALLVPGWSKVGDSYTGTVSALYHAYPNSTSMLSFPFKSGTQYAIRFKAKNATKNSPTGGFYFIYTDGTNSFVYINKTTEADYSLTSTSGKTLKSISPAYADDDTITLRDVQLEEGSTATTYEPYNGETHNISFASAGTVYGGRLDVTSGVLTVTDANIASYNGEALPSTWISDRDVYAIGTTPTTGAQVVYKLATPQTYQLTPTEVKTLLKNNNIWADTGDVTVEYVADTKTFIENLVNA